MKKLAVICALCFIAIYALFIFLNYRNVPDFIPEFHDANGVLIEAVHKSAFIRYGFEFVLLFLLAVLATWIMKPFFKKQVIYLRYASLWFCLPLAKEKSQRICPISLKL